MAQDNRTDRTPGIMQSAPVKSSRQESWRWVPLAACSPVLC